MSKFVVVVLPTVDEVDALAAAHGGTVLPYNVPSVDPAGDTVAVIHFADEYAIAGSKFGTAFGSEWAAREHARHKATDERRWDPDDLRHDFGYNDRVFSLI
jgi:hypothetical protein